MASQAHAQITVGTDMAGYLGELARADGIPPRRYVRFRAMGVNGGEVTATSIIDFDDLASAEHFWLELGQLVLAWRAASAPADAERAS